MLTRIRAERLKRGLTQTALAAASGIHRTEVSKIESRRIRVYPKAAAALASALDLDAATLQDLVP